METKAKEVLSKERDELIFHCSFHSQFLSKAFHMNEVEGHTYKVGQGEVKTCSQL